VSHAEGEGKKEEKSYFREENESNKRVLDLFKRRRKP